VGAGLIYAIIIALWAVVLVPMWVRRHDEARQSKSVDRFSDAMRTLARRPGNSGGREIVVPHRESNPLVHSTSRGPVSAPVSRTSAPLAQRRRRTSLVLIGSVLIVLGLGLLSVVPVWLALVPALLLVGFVVHLRLEQRRADERRERQARRQRELAARSARDEAGIRARVVTTAARSRVEVEVEVEAEAQPDAEGVYDAVADHVWDPVPVPAPTYVNAPKAPRSVRTIDLTRPGHWTSGRGETPATDVDGDAAPAAAAAEVESEEIAPRRAVNG
jgi:hypothetical protein